MGRGEIVMEFELILVRHGETGHNKGRVIQGQLDIPLSDDGVNQAKLLGKNLNNAVWKEVWSSDLKRAWQTANYVINRNADIDDDSLLSQPLPVIRTDPRIRERNYGTAQGKSLANLQQLAGNAGVAIHQFVPPGAETPEEMKCRCISFFDELCARQHLSQSPNSSVLLVSHGGWLREFMMHLSFIASSSSLNSWNMSQVAKICPNTGVSRFNVLLSDGGMVSDIQCSSLHEKSHLENAILCDELAM